MIEEVTGFIVNTVDFGDSSLILNILTKEHGLIGVMGKGVKSMKSRLRTVTQKFTYGSFYIYYKKEKLSLLKDVDIINPLTNLHQNITLIGFLNYVTELIYQVYKESESPYLFDLLIDTVIKMNEGLDPEVLVNILEVKCLSFLGVGLLLDECVSCGKKTEIVTIDGDRGGLICKNCYQNEPLVSLKTIQLLRMYYYVDIKSIQKLDIKKEQKKEINRFLNLYYSRYTGMYLKSKDFLEKLKDL